MLNTSFVLMSHCEHATNLIDQLVSKNVIGVVNVHRYVNVSVSVSSFINMVRRYVITSVTRSKGADCKNMNGFFGLFAGISFQKGNSLNHQCHVSLAESSNTW